jgi:hypothetical protein
MLHAIEIKTFIRRFVSAYTKRFEGHSDIGKVEAMGVLEGLICG